MLRKWRLWKDVVDIEIFPSPHCAAVALFLLTVAEKNQLRNLFRVVCFVLPVVRYMCGTGDGGQFDTHQSLPSLVPWKIKSVCSV